MQLKLWVLGSIVVIVEIPSQEVMTIEDIEPQETKDEYKVDEKENEKEDDEISLPSNGISFTSNQNSIGLKSKYSSGSTHSKSGGNEKMDDDPFRSKASWIIDIRSENDWDNFMASNEDQGLLTIAEVYFDWAGPCHAMTR